MSIKKQVAAWEYSVTLPMSLWRGIAYKKLPVWADNLRRPLSSHIIHSYRNYGRPFPTHDFDSVLVLNENNFRILRELLLIKEYRLPGFDVLRKDIDALREDIDGSGEQFPDESRERVSDKPGGQVPSESRDLD